MAIDDVVLSIATAGCAMSRVAAGGGSGRPVHVPEQSVRRHADPDGDGLLGGFFQKGFSYKEISQQLGISTSTVGTYVQRIYEKLHVSSRREIMARRRPGRG